MPNAARAIGLAFNDPSTVQSVLPHAAVWPRVAQVTMFLSFSDAVKGLKHPGVCLGLIFDSPMRLRRVSGLLAKDFEETGILQYKKKTIGLTDLVARHFSRRSYYRRRRKPMPPVQLRVAKDDTMVRLVEATTMHQFTQKYLNLVYSVPEGDGRTALKRLVRQLLFGWRTEGEVIDDLNKIRHESDLAAQKCVRAVETVLAFLRTSDGVRFKSGFAKLRSRVGNIENSDDLFLQLEKQTGFAAYDFRYFTNVESSESTKGWKI